MRHPSKPLVVVGSLVMDAVARTHRRPRPGETVLGTDFALVPGGKGMNQAIQAALLGARVEMVGRIGEDAFGPLLREAMRRAGVGQSQVLGTTGVPTAVGHIVVDSGGQNAIVLVPGANQLLSREDVRASEDHIREAALLLLQLEVPLEANLEAARIATEAGIPILLDPAPVPDPPPWELLAVASVITPNQGEAELLAGAPVRDEGEAVQAAEILRRHLPEEGVVLITLGDKGALLQGPRERLYLEPHPTIPVDATGAGDAFAGTLAVALAAGMDLRGSARIANVAGALAAGRSGAAPSLPNRRELEAELHRAGRAP